MLSFLGFNALLLFVAYLLGSTPTGYWFGWWFRGIDIREHGSGSTGATNAFRVFGKKLGLLVFVVDVLKAVTAISIVRWCYALPAFTQLASDSVKLESWLPWTIVVAGLFSLFGHSQSIWLMVGKAKNPNLAKGGKSVASGLGVLLAISWPVGLATLGIFAAGLAISRYVSLSSLIGGIGISILMLSTAQPFPYTLFAILATLYIFLRHRANIQRLLDGTEPKVGQKFADFAQ
ncbi:MAG: glycerol-3-phosphate 1-O-acyltransferase PlsY [Geitlerinemataceae cyanobacterium]